MKQTAAGGRIGTGRRFSVVVALILAALACAVVPAAASAATSDLAVSMTTSGTTQLESDIALKVTVRNNGPDASPGANVAVTLPAGMTFVNTVAPAGASCAAPDAGGTITCSLTRSIGKNGTALIQVNLVASALGTASFTASVSGANPDSAPGNNTQTITRTITARTIDIATTMTASATATEAPAQITYTAKVTNTDAKGTATGVAVTLTLPTGPALVSITPSAGSCTGTSCTIDSLAPGGSVTYTLVVQSNSAGVFGATVSTAYPDDPKSSNNSASASATLKGPPTDVAISSFTGPATALQEDTQAYTATVTNAGNAPADGVNVTFTLPAGWVYESATAQSGGLCTDPAAGATSTVNCVVGTLNPGDVSTVTVRANSPSTGSFSVGATANSAANDTAPGNNAASVTTNVTVKVVDLQAVIQDPGPVNAPWSVLVNDSFNLSVVAVNVGTARANGVTIRATIPAGMTFVSYNAGPGNCALVGSELACQLAAVNGGTSRAVQIRLRPTALGAYGVTAVVAGGVNGSLTDSNPGDNTTSATVNAVASLPAPPTGEVAGESGGGGPTTTPRPAPVPVKLTSALGTRKAFRATQGIPVKLEVDAKAALKIALTTKRGRKTTTLATTTRSYTKATRASIVFKLSKKARKALGKLKAGTKLTLTITATAADGSKTTSKLKLKVVKGKKLKVG